MATWRHVETPLARGQSTTMTRGGLRVPDTKPWVSPRAIWLVCLFNRSSRCACWLLGSIQPTRPDHNWAVYLSAPQAQ